MGITQGAVGHFLGGRTKLHNEAVFWFAYLLQCHPLEIDPGLQDKLPPNMAIALSASPIGAPTPRYVLPHAGSQALTVNEPREHPA